MCIFQKKESININEPYHNGVDRSWQGHWLDSSVCILWLISQPLTVFLPVYHTLTMNHISFSAPEEIIITRLTCHQHTNKSWQSHWDRCIIHSPFSDNFLCSKYRIQNGHMNFEDEKKQSIVPFAEVWALMAQVTWRNEIWKSKELWAWYVTELTEPASKVQSHLIYDQ